MHVSTGKQRSGLATRSPAIRATASRSTASRQRPIVANSIYGNGGKASSSPPGRTTTSPPPRSPLPRRWVRRRPVRHVPGTPNGATFIEFFSSARVSCANGGGENYLFSLGHRGPKGTARSVCSVQPVRRRAFTTATATRHNAPSTHRSSPPASRRPWSRSIVQTDPATTPTRHSRSTSPRSGPQDWALWGYNGERLAHRERAQSRGLRHQRLSTAIRATTAPRRSFGQFTCRDSCHLSSTGRYGVSALSTRPPHNERRHHRATAGTGLLAHRARRPGPTDTDCLTSSHHADGTLTATLSDGSTQPFSYTVHAVAGQFTGSGENVPESSHSSTAPRAAAST